MKTDIALNRIAFPHWWGYLLGAGLVALISFIGYLAQSFLFPTDIVLVYILCIVLTAILGGLGPSILACVLSVLTHDFLFIRPTLSFGPPSIQDIPILIVLLVVGTIISYLISQVRRQTIEAKRRELEAHSLYVVSRNLASTDELEASIRAITKSAKEALGCDVSILLPDPQNKKMLKPYSESIEPGLGKNEITAAAWSFENPQKAGRGTDTFPNDKAQYVPLITARGAVGVMAISVLDASSKVTTEQEQLLDAFADLAAVAIERIVFAEEARDTKMSLAATEKLQTALLDSISHDLLTPLASVIGVLSSLQEELGLDSATKKNLLQVACEEAERLNSSITNLLDSSRIQAGTIRISKQPSDVNEIIGVALDQFGDRSGGRVIKVDIATGLPYISADFSLIVKVLLNLLDNAVKYSSPDLPVEIRAWWVGQEVEIEVADRGIGIPPPDLLYIFQRFYRVPHTRVPGLGLGLSICKGIVDAHGGRITAENRYGGGTIIRLTLPVAEDTLENES